MKVTSKIEFMGTFGELRGILDALSIHNYTKLSANIEYNIDETGDIFEKEVLRIASEKGKIHAIKYVRNERNLSVKAAREYVERLITKNE